jgi:SAM-dependent methyltransferase
VPDAQREYWNHNTAYHPWLIDIAEHHHGDVLDVGGGDGLLAQRLSCVSRSVAVIEPDPHAAQRARNRLAGNTNTVVVPTAFERYAPGAQRFDLVAFVASLHHMDLRAGLLKARELLRPDGEIAVVGLSANKSLTDWIWALACLPAVRIGGLAHRETPDVGLVMTDPRESLSEIRRTADEVIRGATVRRALYYRYLLRWTR